MLGMKNAGRELATSSPSPTTSALVRSHTGATASDTLVPASLQPARLRA